MKHTPGPWTHDRDAEVWHDPPDGVRPSVLVADCRDREHDGLSFPPQKEARANAHLIASAPDLLAACEAVVAWVDGGRHEAWWVDSHEKGGLDMEPIEAAIAKAKGES